MSRYEMIDVGKRVFVHTNRKGKGSVYSVHEVKGSKCRPNTPKHNRVTCVVIENCEVYFKEAQRDSILRQVKQRIAKKKDFSGIRRTVYGGLCGELVCDLNDCDSAQEVINLIGENNFERAAFPPTFPKDEDYEEFLKSDVASLEEFSKFGFYLSTREINSFFYFRGREKVPFTSCKCAIFLGSSEEEYAWQLFVLDPT
jgi:hypothetical protein